MIKRFSLIKNKALKLMTFIMVSVCILASAAPVGADYVYEEQTGLFSRKISYDIAKTYTVSNVIAEIKGSKINKLNNATDIYIDKQDFIYVADTGNNRVLKLDKEGLLIFEYTGAEGIGFKAPEGVYADNSGDIYISDTGNQRIVHITPSGKHVETFIKPRDAQISFDDVEFRPTKIYINKTGYIYFLKHHELVSMDADNNFRGAIVSSTVPVTGLDFIRQLFYTKQQRKQITRAILPPFNNFFIADDGFVYAVNGAERGQIMKINWIGKNVYPENISFGEKSAGKNGLTVKPSFSDIMVDKYGVIYTLDRNNGNMYRYDQEGNLLSVYGINQSNDSGKASELKNIPKGCFIEPVGLGISTEQKVYVLDYQANVIQVLEPTTFTTLTNKATSLYINGLYSEAIDTWETVLQICSNYSIALKGMAKAKFKDGKWDEAMELYKKADDKKGYSVAFNESRREQYRSYFIFVVVFAAVAVGAVLYVISKLSLYVRRDGLDKYLD